LIHGAQIPDGLTRGVKKDVGMLEVSGALESLAQAQLALQHRDRPGTEYDAAVLGDFRPIAIHAPVRDFRPIRNSLPQEYRSDGSEDLR
jgi:hypothetical protein